MALSLSFGLSLLPSLQSATAAVSFMSKSYLEPSFHSAELALNVQTQFMSA